MIQPLIRLPLRLLLPIAGLPLGALSLAAEHLETWNQSGSASVRLESPRSINDPGAIVPELSELYTVPIESGLNADPTDLWIVRGVRTAEFGEPGDGEETVRGVRFFSRYETWNRSARRSAENGMLVWRFQEDPEVAITGGGNIGFIRSRHRPGELPAEPVVGHFTGAEGSISWVVKSSGTRIALIEMTQAEYRPEHRFESFLDLNISQDGAVNLPAFQFPVPDHSPVAYWRFGATTPRRMADGIYMDIISRTDSLTEEEVYPAGGGSSQFHGDPQDFWSRIYFLRLEDSEDSDRDGVPDFADLTHSLNEFPWYADFNGGNHWYYSVWLNSWIYSDRRVSEHWDYSLQIGWTYVPLSSSRDQFWVYSIARITSTQAVDAPAEPADDQLGWIYTNRTYFPNYYRASTGEVLQLLAPGQDQPAGSATFYNFTRQRFETVQF